MLQLNYTNFSPRSLRYTGPESRKFKGTPHVPEASTLKVPGHLKKQDVTQP